MATEVYVLLVTHRGVTEHVVAADSDEPLLDKVSRWEPDVRLGRVAWQDFGYKRGVVTRGGLRSYELFAAPMITDGTLSQAPTRPTAIGKRH